MLPQPGASPSRLRTHRTPRPPSGWACATRSTAADRRVRGPLDSRDGFGGDTNLRKFLRDAPNCQNGRRSGAERFRRFAIMAAISAVLLSASACVLKPQACVYTIAKYLLTPSSPQEASRYPASHCRSGGQPHRTLLECRGQGLSHELLCHDA